MTCFTDMTLISIVIVDDICCFFLLTPIFVSAQTNIGLGFFYPFFKHKKTQPKLGLCNHSFWQLVLNLRFWRLFFRKREVKQYVAKNSCCC